MFKKFAKSGNLTGRINLSNSDLEGIQQTYLRQSKAVGQGKALEWTLAQMMDRFGAVGIIPALRNMSEHVNPTTREMAVRLLGTTGNPSTAGILEKRVGEDTHRGTRLAALGALAKLSPGGHPIPTFGRVLERRDDRQVQKRILEVSGELRHRRSLDLLIGAAKNTTLPIPVRKSAFTGLKAITQFIELKAPALVNLSIITEQTKSPELRKFGRELIRSLKTSGG